MKPLGFRKSPRNLGGLSLNVAPCLCDSVLIPSKFVEQGILRGQWACSGTGRSFGGGLVRCSAVRERPPGHFTDLLHTKMHRGGRTLSKGAEGSILAALSAWITVYSEKVEVPMKW
eukprot:535792-Pelagomonas_calceolata.AAC.4